jgi:predicted flap endonuclease-1-like 5' DNA nuclease
MEISGLQQDVGGWKDKWQAAKSSLDEQESFANSKEEALCRLTSELDELNGVWQKSTISLEDRDHEIVMLRDESASLNERNANLFETTELANRQIETLGANLTQLRDQLREKTNSLVDLQAGDAETAAERETLREQLGTLGQQHETQAKDLDTARQSIEAMQQQVVRLESKIGESDEQLIGFAAVRESEARPQTELSERVEELTQLKHSFAGIEDETRALEGHVAEEHGEVERLQQCVASTEQVTNDREGQRRELSERLSEVQARNDRLSEQLNERSKLVVGLEQEKLAAESAAQELSQQNEQLGEALAKAKRHASEHAEHIAHLDSRLEIQKERMLKLAEELAKNRGAQPTVQVDHAQAAAEDQPPFAQTREDLAGDAGTADGAEPVSAVTYEKLTGKIKELEDQLEARNQENPSEVADPESSTEVADAAGEEVGQLQHEVHKLEQIVRERTEQLNNMRWQQDMAEPVEGATNMGGDNKMLVVLNQQLVDARESNERLVAQVRDLEARLAEGAGATPTDDLTAIRGIGPKLAGQLVELGVSSFSQIAQLKEEDLADEVDLLNGFKSRIQKDDWISQARRLVQG